MTDTTTAPDAAVDAPALPAVGSVVRYSWTDPTFGDKVDGLAVVLKAVPEIPGATENDPPTSAYVEVSPLPVGLRVSPDAIAAL